MHPEGWLRRGREDGAVSQGMWAASRSCRRRANMLLEPAAGASSADLLV